MVKVERNISSSLESSGIFQIRDYISIPRQQGAASPSELPLAPPLYWSKPAGRSGVINQKLGASARFLQRRLHSVPEGKHGVNGSLRSTHLFSRRTQWAWLSIGATATFRAFWPILTTRTRRANFTLQKIENEITISAFKKKTTFLCQCLKTPVTNRPNQWRKWRPRRVPKELRRTRKHRR